MVTGPAGNDTMVYHVADGKWESVNGGDTALVNGYCHYNAETDMVLMNFQLDCFKLHYVPSK